MTGGEVIMFILGVCLGGMLGILLAGLLRHASDLELRMAHHVRQEDPDYFRQTHNEKVDEHENITKY